ncbi:hypothetical protein [Roseovarius sp. SYSU LYC5161]|uniref:hypothetical protein n=1 Tax=Roseovarius halophilus (ex Wu et al. 2025) TaxID=3376060 RepID=UPI0028710D41|nr:hypothetical protein [Roseovarius sp.]
MTPEVQRELRQVILGVRSFADAEAAMPFLEALLGMGPAAITGILVDEMTSGLAVGRRQRVVTETGALIEVPTAQRAREIARSEARAIRESLSAAARRSSAEWRLDLAAGDLAETVWRAARQSDLVMFGYRPIRKYQGRVVLILDPDDPEPDLKAAAETLAASLGTDVTVIEAPLEESAALVSEKVDRLHAAVILTSLHAGRIATINDLRLFLSAARCPVALSGMGDLVQVSDAS